MAPRFDDSRWFHPGGYPPPPRVPLSLVALALSLRRATGSVHAPVARGKRSAPAKHSGRSADGSAEVKGRTVASSRRLFAALAGASFARYSRSFVTPRYGVQ